MSLSDTLINTVFDGRYRIVRKLGAGGMANVYLAEDADLGRRVAIKILNDRYANDELFVERFRREAKSAAALSHPNIVSIYDRGEAAGHPYIAMEVIEGRSLKELIVGRGRLPVGVAVAYAQQLLAALRFAHKNGIIHRDIKPHNILVGPEERLKVTDFGIARAGASQMTEAGSIIGTAQYLSPEQARGAPVTAASDVYSAGIVLYEMLTGEVPYGGDTPIEIAMKHLNETPRPPSALAPDVPEELDQVVLRALAKDPADRFQSAEEFSRELERVAAGLPVSARTAEAATALLAGTAATQAFSGAAPTRVAQRATAPPRRPPVYPPGYGYDEPPPPRRPPKRRNVWPWLLVAFLVGVAAFAGWYVYQQIAEELRAAEPVGVPLVVGLREQQAVNQIENRELEARIEREPSTEQPAGIVFRQEPQAGTRISRGDQVTIYVSEGPPLVEVPRVTGMQYEDAVQELAEANLRAERQDFFSARPPGEVVAQRPRPGEEAEEDAVVVLRVSRGRQQIAVPNVLNRTQESAVAELEAAGFAADVSSASSDTAAGLVFAQNPNPGTEAPRGSTVSITVSTGPETRQVPNVVGQASENAEAALAEAGFSVQVQETDTSDPAQDDLVVSQDPGGNTQARPGATVTIVVARFIEPPEGDDG